MSIWQFNAGLDTTAPLRCDQVETLLVELGSRATTVECNGVELSISLTIETSSRAGPVRAAELGVLVVTRVVVYTGGRVARWRGVEAVTGDPAEHTHQADHADHVSPTVPALVGGADAAHILGLSRQRLRQVRQQDARFPSPVAHIGSTPVWTRASIEAFKAVQQRTPTRHGRPVSAVGDDMPTLSRRGRPEDKAASVRRR